MPPIPYPLSNIHNLTDEVDNDKRGQDKMRLGNALKRMPKRRNEEEAKAK